MTLLLFSGAPRADETRFDDAQALLAKHKWAEATVVLRSLLKEDPKSPEVAVSLSRALTYSGRREEALGILARTADLEKGAKRATLIRRTRVLSKIFLTKENSQVYEEGLNLLVAKKYHEAQKSLEHALEQEPDNVEILTRLGQALALQSDFDSAAERLRLANRLDPFEPEVHLWLGHALRQRGEMRTALTELQAASNALPDSEVAHSWYAEALAANGQRSAGMQILETDLKAHPFHLLGLVTLAKLRMDSAGPRETQTLWDARRDLQIAQSRLDQYGAAQTPEDLGLDLREPALLKQEIETLLQKIDTRISGQPTEG